jgi:hypothetical protein
MKANEREKRPDNLTLLVIALAVLCVVVLVVVIVLGVRVLGSRNSDDATPTVASLVTLTATQAPAETAVSAETPSATLVPSVTAETETPTPTATATPTQTETPTKDTPTPSDTPTPTITLTPEPTPDCAVKPAGEFAALWEDYNVELGCPLYPTPKAIQDAEQPFENGHMFWREDLRHIYVVYEQGPLEGTWQAFVDEWEEGDPDYSCAAPPPPPEREQPKRGFGLVWCKLGGTDAEIGWALEEELGFFEGQGDPLAQDFDFGVVFRDSLGTVNGKAYVFFSETGTFVHVSY